MSDEIKPTEEQLNDPYVLQLIEALSRQQDQIEDLEDDVLELLQVVASAKPAPPCNRLIRESDSGPYCEQCGSSMRLRYMFIRAVARTRTKNCIQPECKNYGG